LNVSGVDKAVLRGHSRSFANRVDALTNVLENAAVMKDGNPSGIEIVSEEALEHLPLKAEAISQWNETTRVCCRADARF
jgi:hypothetical protein